MTQVPSISQIIDVIYEATNDIRNNSKLLNEAETYLIDKVAERLPVNMQHIPRDVIARAVLASMATIFGNKSDAILDDLAQELHRYGNCDGCGSKASDLPPTVN